MIQRATVSLLCFPILLACVGASAPALRAHPAQASGDFVALPDLAALAREGGMRAVIERWQADRRTLEEFFDLETAPVRRARLGELHAAWLAGLASIDFAGLPRGQQVDWLLLRDELRRRIKELELEAERLGEVAVALPFAEAIEGLHGARRDLEPVDPQAAAQLLTELAEGLEDVRERLARAGDDDLGERTA
ncbi:MAG TPA: hypothetical protein VMT18_11180, partial [Planctomycetota bacterium]|nr:hypothetical protein [Planctomycetota bacterium]